MGNCTFNHQGSYICECGKEFDSSQKFNGHKSGCRVHLGEEKYQQRLARSKAALVKGVQLQKETTKKKHYDENITWISEQHKCEHCGFIMTTKYGTGRFCCQKCAKSHSKSVEERQKVSKSLLLRYNPNLTQDELELLSLQNIERNDKKKHKISDRQSQDQEQHLDKLLPTVQDEQKSREKGWQNRKIKNSYPEQFWMRVFDNNGIQYEREYQIKNENSTGSYKLDFLIDDVYDIEIDGSQHKQNDIFQKDIRRDLYLKSLGYKVYRIPWVPPVTFEKKKIVYNQIVKLFEYMEKQLIQDQSENKDNPQ